MFVNRYPKKDGNLEYGEFLFIDLILFVHPCGLRLCHTLRHFKRLLHICFKVSSGFFKLGTALFKNILFIYLFILVVLGFELRASFSLGRCSAA
jgi:hypothetical protein